MSATTRFGHLGGGLLTTAGALGLALTGLADPLSTEGRTLLLVEVNAAQNLLHLLLGLVLVVGAAGSTSASRASTMVASGALGMLGVVGLAMNGPNPLALDAWGNALHLGLAAWGAVALLRDTHTDATADGGRTEVTT